MIYLLVPLLISTSCIDRDSFWRMESAVVKVGNTSLYPSDVAMAIPEGLSHEDSLAFASKYQLRWAKREAKLVEAKSIFSSSSDDIERMVEEYRNTLLLDKLDRHIAQMVQDTTITTSQIREFYDKNIAEYRVEKPLVRYKLLIYDASYSNSDNLLKLFSSSKSVDIEDLRSICEKNIFTLHEYDTQWSIYDTMYELLPPLDEATRRDMLKQEKIHKFSSAGENYYLKILSHRDVGDKIPFELVQDRIRDILLKQYQQQSLIEYGDQLYYQALQRGDISYPSTSYMQ